jgi:anthranilate synthase component II
MICNHNHPMSVLFIDNFDSFVFNLVDEFSNRGCSVEVWRNDLPAKKALEIVAKIKGPSMIVLSPGPGTPQTAGCCLDIIRQVPVDVPVLGVCLGFQAIVEAFGGEVVQAPEIVHGRTSMIKHSGEGIFKGLAAPLTVARYHSLMAGSVPGDLEVTASLGHMPMAVQHVRRKIVGVQFHPESILTPAGGKLIDNILAWAGDKQPITDSLIPNRNKEKSRCALC